MHLPFTIGQFLEAFRRYNESVWPAHWALVGLSIVAVLLVTRRTSGADRVISGILAALWVWMGAVYHLVFFRPINPAAPLFAVGFFVEAGAIAWIGIARGRLAFRPRADASGVIGALLLVYALALYPALAYGFGHRYPAAPTFGLPCPTTIFTMGLLLWTGRSAGGLLIVPLLWSLIGALAATELGMTEDLGLLLAAVLTTAESIRSRWQSVRHQPIVAPTGPPARSRRAWRGWR